MDYRQELLAVQPTSAKTVEYAEMWRPCGMNINKHFIIIFNLRMPTPSSSQGGDLQNGLFSSLDLRRFTASRSPYHSPSPLNTTPPSRSPSVPAISRSPSAIPPVPSPLGYGDSSNAGPTQPGFNEMQLVDGALGGVTSGENDGSFFIQYPQFGEIVSGRRDGMQGIQHGGVTIGDNSTSFDTPRPPYDGITPGENGALLNLQYHDSMLGENGASLNAQNPQPNAMQTNTLGPGMAIEAVCAQFGIAPDVIKAAKCNSANDKDKNLLSMVLNHRAMMQILVTLRYHDRNTTPKKKKIVQFSSGMELSVESLLQAFDWSFQSYKHKTKWYSWAERVTNGTAWNESMGE